MICDREPQSSPAPSQPQRDERQPQPTLRWRPAVKPKKPRIRRPHRIAPGSVLDTLRRNSGTSLFVRPLCWTDQHAQLLGIQFNELPVCDTPMPVNEPGSPPSKGHMEPSQTIMTLSDTLTNILSHKIAHPLVVSNAVRTVMSTLWPACFQFSFLVPELHLYFGDKVYREVARAQIMWTYPGGSYLPSQNSLDSSQSTQLTDSHHASPSQESSTPRRHRLTGQPMICYMGKAQLASIRRNMFRIMPGPNGQYNEPVYRLQQLRSKNFEPNNPDEDSHIAGIMLAMAQKHFYSNPRVLAIFRKGISPAVDARPFCDLKLRLMTHDTERAEFIVYTGHMTTTFLERFRRPHRMPPATDSDEEDLGLKIDYVRVPIWPILGLRERLGKALGEDLVGSFDPEAMETWEEDGVEAPKSSGSKRKRTALAEVVNRSFEESEEDQSSPTRNKKQCVRQGTPVQAAA
ncbi:hypothetical protein LEL_05332 [Akanthomyces lecanii RCEF 1005]|uniref:Uncharacterized protein n=1 Tax=Akanthomyces lecanii RCEF 1005 TaxID=1081108 RepID=A0A168HZA2_CORDF|nr:hypothetical protein LEL_05332 [Akanthomyces lecanii RCEF 1005]